MTEPKWLSREAVEQIHTRVIEVAGGSHGLRDASLLESALARPQNLYAYGEADTFQLAASYAEGISRNHAFIDGNKRTAFQAADVFLFINGHELLPRKDDGYVKIMECLGQGKLSREEAAAYFQQNARTRVYEQLQASPPAKDWLQERVSKSEIKPLPERGKDRDWER